MTLAEGKKEKRRKNEKISAVHTHTHIYIYVFGNYYSKGHEEVKTRTAGAES